MKFEIKSWVDGTILFSGKFGSLKLCIEAAVKSHASLVGASLDGARLDGASLDGARLVGAGLVCQLGQPNGWWAWTCCVDDRSQRVRVGCRDFTLAEGRAYWAGKENRREVLAALDYAEAIGKLRGWKQA